MKKLIGLVMCVWLLLYGCVIDPQKQVTTGMNLEIANQRFYPQRWIVPSGQEITITVVNSDGRTHTIAILKYQIPGGLDVSDENIYWKATIDSSSREYVFTAPAMAGEYVVTCLGAGHTMEGEEGRLVVVVPYDENGQ